MYVRLSDDPTLAQQDGFFPVEDRSDTSVKAVADAIHSRAARRGDGGPPIGDESS